MQAKLDARAAKDAERARVIQARTPASPWANMATTGARAASSSIGRQVANEIGRQVFGTKRRSSSVGGGLIGTVARSVLGNLFRGR